MQNLTVKVNPSRHTCSIAKSIYLGGKYNVTYEPDGVYQMRIVAPSSEYPGEGIVVWAETDGTGKRLELNRRVLFNEFKRQNARQPGMTIMAKLYILDASVTGGSYANGGEPVADGNVTIEYVPCNEIIDPAAYQSAREMLDTAWGYKEEAKGFRDEAEDFRDDAEQFKNNAKNFADDAKQYAENAAAQVTAAAGEADRAELARTEAQEAQVKAEEAWVGAEAAASNAEQTAEEFKDYLDKIDALEKGLQDEAWIRSDEDTAIRRLIEELGGGAVFLPSYEDIVALEDKKEDRIYVATQTNTLYRCVYKDYFKWDVVQIGGAGGGVEVYEWMDQLPTPGKEDVIYCVTETDFVLTKLYTWRSDIADYRQITYSIVEIEELISHGLFGLKYEVLPRYPFVYAAIADGAVTVEPYTNVKLESDDTAFTVAVGGTSEFMRDCVLCVECGETAPTITWPANFHPRTDAETDFACVAGVRNVYWITEHAPGEFCVAGWQKTTGGIAA